MFVIGGSTILLKSPKVSDNENQTNDENFDNDSQSDNNDEGRKTKTKNNCKSAKGHLCVNIETGHLTNIEIEGNFLQGLSLFTAIYDEINKKIVVFGGTDSKGKASKGLPIITMLEIPQRYTLDSVKPPEGPVDVDKISFVASFYSRTNIDSFLILKDLDNVTRGQNNNENSNVLNHAGGRRKKNKCPLMDSSSNSPSTSIQSLKSDDDEHDAKTNQSENEFIGESGSTGSVILEKQEQNTDDDDEELNDKNEIEKESPLNLGDDKNAENDQNKNVNFKRNRKFSQMRVQDDQEIRANIRIRTPSQYSKERRTSLL